MKNLFTLLLISFLMLTSCVPYKNTVYLQGTPQKQQKDTASYKIQKNDILFVEIKSSDKDVQQIFNTGSQNANTQSLSNQALYFKGYTVNNNGEITLPYLGNFKVLGLTFPQVVNSVKQRLLQKQLKTTDNIFVNVKLAGVPYTILGEVKSPTVDVLYKEKPTVFDAIAASGDITQVGNRKQVLIIRKEGGKEIKHLIDLTDASVVTSPYYYLRPNDVIYVQPLRQKSLGTGTTLLQTVRDTVMALSLISSIVLLVKYSK